MSTFSLQQISFEPLGGWVGLVLLIGAAIALASWTYLRSPAPLSRRRRITLWTCRALALVVLILLLSRPIAILSQERSGRPEVVVLADASGSALLGAEAGGPARLDEIRSNVEALTASLSDRYDVSVRPFADELGPEVSSARELDADSTRASAPGDALDRLAREPREAPLAAVVLVTDGAAARGKDLVSTAARLGAPLFVSVVGDSVPPPDVQVVGIDAPPAAFVGETVRVTARLRNVGTAPAAIWIELDGGEDPPLRQRVEVVGGGALQEITFEVTPTRPGLTFYRLGIEPADAASSEANLLTVNDELHVALDVRKDRLQVLVLDEQLSWDFTFLRRTLERDTTLAYSYLVRPADRTIALPGSRVTGFPADLEALSAFQAVVVGDLSSGFLSPNEMERLARHVEAGGGLLVLGGNRAWGMSRFAGTPLERVLPVAPTAPPRHGEGSIDGPPLPLEVTVLGDVDPLVVLHGDLYGNRSMWADLPPLRPAVGAEAGRSGSQVLVRLRGESATYPLVTVGRYGGGRVLAFTGRALWQWKFLREGVGGRDDFFDRFWVGVMRWLSDPEPSARVNVRPDRDVFRQGDVVSLSGRALAADLTPLPPSSVRVRVVSERDSVRLEGEWGEGGDVTFRAPMLPPGRYAYELTVDEPGTAPLRREGVFRVERAGPEWWDLASNPDLLRRAAGSSGGRVVPANGIGALPDEIPVSTLSASLTREYLLWNHPLPFLIFLVSVGTEWWLRRRGGLA